MDEKQFMKEIADYVWEMINAKDLQKYKWGHHTKFLVKLARCLSKLNPPKKPNKN